MGRFYAVNYLTPEQHAMVDACIRRRRYSGIDQIKDELAQSGIKLGRSSLHRYIQTLREKDGLHTGTTDDTVVIVVERGGGTVTTLTTGASGAAVMAMIQSVKVIA